MNTPGSIDELRIAVCKWTWDELRAALVDFGRYTDAQLLVLRQERDRRIGVKSPSDARPADVRCTRCGIVLSFAGTKKFHEGASWGVLGDIAEMFVQKEKFDVYFCPRCGKVEFFVDGIGDELRPQ